ncbi:N-acyl-L-homoserine lactone (AHL) synthase [Rhizobium pusense]|uniref:acyl-homoserine-lactone synthase n=1 Tax=Agrobacterium pusense TaxID=648995 RepID=UPI0024490CB9|nr:acyl-homoserine-lactone synthase [Agrobacterium pusense]MDH1270586.1 N-acyl-L-homoserine lactone (AHL) synthase [Agrobacterium pusense]
MYLLVQAHQYARYSSLLEQSFRLRKRIFHDTLNWKVDVAGDFERDAYDDLGPAYLMWCNHDASKLYGTLRLMPTTGPTLLHDVFGRTCPDVDLMAPGIWEGTRMCIDVEALRQDEPELDSSKAFCLLLLALCECAMAHGIDTLVCNYEPQMARIYRRAGLPVDEVGRADGYGRFPVCCGVFDVSRNTHLKMQNALGIAHPLYCYNSSGGADIVQPVRNFT